MTVSPDTRTVRPPRAFYAPAFALRGSSRPLQGRKPGLLAGVLEGDDSDDSKQGVASPQPATSADKGAPFRCGCGVRVPNATTSQTTTAG